MAQQGTSSTTAPVGTGLDLAAFNAMSEGIVVQSSDGSILQSNPAASHILGLTPDELTGRTSLDPRWRAVHEDGSPFPGDTHPAMVALATRQPQRGVVMGVHTPEGELHWLLVNVDPIPGAVDEQDPSVIVSFTDITEQMLLKAALAETEERYRLIAENSADVILRVIDGRVAWVSPSLTAVVGWDPETWIGRPPTDFINPDDFAALELDMPALEAGLTVRTRARILDPTDSYHWVEGTARRYSSGPQGEVSILIAFRDIDAELAAAELEHRASHDTLTGLLNRDEATERLTEILDSPGTHPVAVAFCDVDDFKAINDTYGHLAGDAVLQSLADSIRAHVRDVDHVARFGGDEILVVLDGVRDLTDAERIADSVRRRVQAPIRYGHDLLDVTMSIGVTLVSPGEPIEALLDRVDLAMYKAKRDGKNRVRAVPAPSVLLG